MTHVVTSAIHIVMHAIHKQVNARGVGQAGTGTLVSVIVVRTVYAIVVVTHACSVK